MTEFIKKLDKNIQDDKKQNEIPSKEIFSLLKQKAIDSIGNNACVDFLEDPCEIFPYIDLIINDDRQYIPEEIVLYLFKAIYFILESFNASISEDVSCYYERIFNNCDA